MNNINNNNVIFVNIINVLERVRDLENDCSCSYLRSACYSPNSLTHSKLSSALRSSRLSCSIGEGGTCRTHSNAQVSQGVSAQMSEYCR